jgi:predicted MFS family arabinose efflux permease
MAQNLLNFALIIRVFELTKGTPYNNLAVGSVVLSFGLSAILFAALAGVFVDHWDRRRVLWISNLLRAVLVLLYLVGERNLLVVILLTFIISTVTQFFTPAEAAAIPRLVKKDQLVKANASFVMTFYVCFVAGYLAAAPVIKLLGIHPTYMLTSLLFFAAAALAFSLPELQAKGAPKLSWTQLWRLPGRELIQNWQFILLHRSLLFPMIQLALVQMVLGSVLTLAPGLSLKLLGQPLQDVGHILIVPAGIGLVAGVAAVGKLSKRYRSIWMIAFMGLVMAIGLTALGLSGNLAQLFGLSIMELEVLIGVLAFVLGLANAIISVASQTMLQINAGDERRGKVFGALQMMINIAGTIPVFFAAVLADKFSPTLVIAVIGGLVLLVAMVQVSMVAGRYVKNNLGQSG